MTRVVQVVVPAHFGGIERVVHALAIGQHARGHEVHVVSVVRRGDADSPFHGPLREAGVPLHVVEIASRGYLSERRAIRRLCRQLAPDVVHTHGYRADVVDGGVARGLGIPTVSTMHGFFHEGSWKGRLSERLHLATFARFDAVVAVSAALGRDMRGRGVPADLLSVVPNAWFANAPFLPRSEARRILGIPESALVAGWVGRIHTQKALDVAIAALGRLQDTSISLAIVGDGEERSRIESQAAAAGLGGRLTWYGARSNAFEVMRAFDVFVLSSVWEGTPIVVLEAMAAGTPIVATSVGGVPDMVSAGEAKLVPAADAGALAEAIRDVITNRDAAKHRADAALRRIREEYGLEAWLDRYDTVYRSAADRRRRRPS